MQVLELRGAIIRTSSTLIRFVVHIQGRQQQLLINTPIMNLASPPSSLEEAAAAASISLECASGEVRVMIPLQSLGTTADDGEENAQQEEREAGFSFLCFICFMAILVLSISQMLSSSRRVVSPGFVMLWCVACMPAAVVVAAQFYPCIVVAGNKKRAKREGIWSSVVLMFLLLVHYNALLALL